MRTQGGSRTFRSDVVKSTMTESEWLAAIDLSVGPREFAVARLSERKRQLFSCACCRRIWELLTADLRRGVEAAERSADGLLRKGDRIRVEQRLTRLAAGGDVKEFGA